MSHRTVFPALTALTALLLAVPACDSDLKDEKFGDLEITTTAPTIEQPFVTADGWSVDYEQFLVHLTAINVAGLEDEVLTASAAEVVVDQAKPGPKQLLFSSVRKPRTWDDVNFQIGPALPAEESAATLLGYEAPETTTEAPPPPPPELALLQSGGYSIYVTGTATRGAEVKKFAWGLTTDTLYSACTGGITVPPDALGTVNITMSGTAFFADDLLVGAPLRFDPIAAADADGDGNVTLDELVAVPIEDVRTATGAMYSGESETLAGYLSEQARGIVSGYGSQGTCTAEAVTEETE